MNASNPKILYFTEDMVPTPDESLELESLTFPVQVRNAKYVDGKEPCDGVLGAAPDEFYADSPNGDDVIKKFKAGKKAELERLREGLDVDKPAPKKREKKVATGDDKPSFVPGGSEVK